MKTTYKSPFASSYISGIRSGLTSTQVVTNISRKTGKSCSSIFQSLTKAGWCRKQNFNGTWCYWPVNIKVRSNKSSATSCQQWIKQMFIDWCIISGACTPVTLTAKSVNSGRFTSYCKTLWSSKSSTLAARKTSFTSKNTVSTVSSGSRATKSTGVRKTTHRSTRRSTPASWARTYKFAAYANRANSTKRYRKVA